jgi:GrpE
MGDELDKGSEVSASGDDAADVGAADPAALVDLAKHANPLPAAVEPSSDPDAVPQADPVHVPDPAQGAQVTEPESPSEPGPPASDASKSPAPETPAPGPAAATSVAPETPAPETPAPAAAAAAASGPEQVPPVAFAVAVDSIQTRLSALGDRVGDIADATAEFARLRSRDAELIGRLHDDVTRLRTGEIAAALNPVVTGMIKLHDQMVSLGALNDPASPVGMLHTQLLQILELTCAVKPFAPSAGEQFDASHHTGVKRIVTADPAADGTVAATIKVGFVRADGSVVRVAEVEVHRLSG